MTLQDKIALLPEWPTWEGTHAGVPSGDLKLLADIEYYGGRYEAALARLALAREFMKMVIADGADAEDGADCSCPWCSNARALLAALEGPK